MELVDRLGKLMVAPRTAKPMIELDRLRKRVDQVEKSDRVIKGEFE